jgi:universal stress protein family protein
MKNRFFGEADAYVFLLVAIIVHCAVVIGTHYGGILLALVAVVFLTPVACGLRRRKPALGAEPLAELPPPTDPKRILVLANETVADQKLVEELGARAQAGTEILVVSPAVNSRLRHWTSDEDAARAAAKSRLEASLERLAMAGLEAQGRVGDADPVQAIADAMWSFNADEIVLSTHPPERRHWLARDITERVRRLFEIPVTHIVVDLAGEHEVGPAQAAAEGSVA